jgi:hypothetical protein
MMLSRRVPMPTPSRFVGGKHIERSINVIRELSEAEEVQWSPRPG